MNKKEKENMRLALAVIDDKSSSRADTLRAHAAIIRCSITEMPSDAAQSLRDSALVELMEAVADLHKLIGEKNGRSQ
jgi:hypothetical protein